MRYLIRQTKCLAPVLIHAYLDKTCVLLKRSQRILNLHMTSLLNTTT